MLCWNNSSCLSLLWHSNTITFCFFFETLESSHIIMAMGHWTFILIGAKGATKQHTPSCAHTLRIQCFKHWSASIQNSWFPEWLDKGVTQVYKGKYLVAHSYSLGVALWEVGVGEKSGRPWGACLQRGSCMVPLQFLGTHGCAWSIASA